MTETILSIFLGVGLAASVGFRVFLPLFALSLAAYFNVWELNESWLWIGSTTALITLGIATLVEIVAYYIPVIDNALDTIAIPLATIAGTAVMVSTVADLSPVITWALAIIAGGGTAAAVKSSASATRLGSTVSTAGFGNPIVSTIETGTSIIMSIISIFMPILAIVFVLFIFYLIFKLYRKIRPNKTKPPNTN
ncbi:DUF4126 domain-containing protein [Winogradskyella litoriviva]|uniref:DUF4126 domain-containing protein n=1 Tax=Winogradskyella litoriviva TaxID=1220182 RepID=A0ABX2E1Z7_9FLAO|nr:DUF4126 domain-containing protein [Winogradskyella litoriviva]NRD22513.1 DUF4126 domain-containing protein [Winogradskyella litoriviva]